MTTNMLWTVKKVENGNRREDYIFLLGRLIMKRWYIDGKRVQNRVFHEGEGLTQFNSEIRNGSFKSYTSIMSWPDKGS